MTIKIDPAVRSNNVCEKVMGARSAFVWQVLKRHHDGLSIKQLAEEFGVSVDTIYKALNRAEAETGIKRQERPSSKKMTQDQVDMAASLLNQGWSINRTAQKVGVNFGAIQYRVQVGSLPSSHHASPVHQHKEVVIRELEERIMRMKRMATYGIY